MEDILIFSITWENKLQQIQHILSTLWKHKLYANLEKSLFSMHITHYLGHNMYEHGVHVDLANIQFIHDWLSSKTIIELQYFLDLSKFYLRLMLVLSHISWPLNQVTKGGSKAIFSYSKSQKKSFKDMKHHLFLAPILTLSGCNKHLILRQMSLNMILV